MKTIICTLALLMVGCSSMPEMNKWTAPSYRVAIDPDSIDSGNYVQVRDALMQSGRFFVVERGVGLNAVVKEQDIENTHGMDRFGDEDKYARLGRLFGVGSIIVAAVQCSPRTGLFGKEYMHCLEFAAFVDSVSGQVIASVKGEDDSGEMWYGSPRISADWTKTIERLMEAIPSHYEQEKYDKRMRFYRKEIAEDARRLRVKHGGEE